MTSEEESLDTYISAVIELKRCKSFCDVSQEVSNIIDKQEAFFERCRITKTAERMDWIRLVTDEARRAMLHDSTPTQ